MTRHRTRDGKVTLYTYDSPWNQLAKAVGLEVVSGTDQQTADYAVYTYEYYGSTHANAGLRKALTSRKATQLRQINPGFRLTYAVTSQALGRSYGTARQG